MTASPHPPATAPRNGKPPGSTVTVHLLSGATGDLLHRLAAVVTTQFSGVTFELAPHRLLDTPEKLTAALGGLTGARPVVIHALADPVLKAAVRQWCVPRSIPQFDATGPLVDFMADCVGALPDNDLTQLHRLDEAYRRRIEAMEFVMDHDDGLGLRNLRAAEVVIVGVSRVSKSPTSLYLGSRGLKVANVSFAPETGIPADLAKIKQNKIVALTTQPKRLQEIRAERAERMGLAGSAYDDLPSVIREVMEAEAEYRRRGWPVIDVTSLTIEQTAARIVEVLGLTPL